MTANNQNRIEPNKPAAEYHADLTTISKHGLDLIHRAPALYRYEKTRTEPKLSTPAMRWGTLVHLAVLEPHLLGAQTVIAPDVDKRTKAGKEAWEAASLEAAAKGALIVTGDELEQLNAIRSSVYAHPAARVLLEGDVEIENSVYWSDADTEIACRARPDAVRLDGIIFDLKTTEDASPAAFARSVATYRYHVQAAFYLDGLRAAGAQIDAFAFVAVEKTPPYLVSVYALDDISVSKGREAYRTDLMVYAECLRTDCWPGYAPTIQPLSLPAWALK